MKKLTGFEVKENQTDRSLDRFNELNMYFNRFSSDHWSSNTDHTLPVATSSLLHLYDVSLYLSHGFQHSLINISPHIRIQWDLLCPCLTPAARWRGSRRDWTRTRLQVQMVSRPESGRPVWNSFVGSTAPLQPLGLSLEKVQVLLKTSSLVPVPKKISCIYP